MYFNVGKQESALDPVTFLGAFCLKDEQVAIDNRVFLALSILGPQAILTLVPRCEGEISKVNTA